MLFAQAVEPATGVQLGNWLVPAVAVMGVLYLVIKVYREFVPRAPEKTVPELPVTHAELDSWKTQSAEFATKEQMRVMEKDLRRVEENVTRMENSTKVSIHRLGDALQLLLLKQATMNERLRLLCQKNSIPVSDDDDLIVPPKASGE